MTEWTEYAVEIRVPIDAQGTARTGTGYLLPNGRILTALHVLVGEEWPNFDSARVPREISVRIYGDYVARFKSYFGNDPETAFKQIAEAANGDYCWLRAQLVWPTSHLEDDLDLAILQVNEPTRGSLFASPRQILCNDPKENVGCQLYGFPDWQWTETKDGISRSRPVQFEANLIYGATIDVLVRDANITSSTPDDLDGWKGISGAAIFTKSAHFLVGIVLQAFPSSNNNNIKILMLSDIIDRAQDFWSISGLNLPKDDAETTRNNYKVYINRSAAIAADSLGNRSYELVDSPLKAIWSFYLNSQPWRATIRAALDTCDTYCKNYPEKFGILSNLVEKISTTEIYPQIRSSLGVFLRQAAKIDAEAHSLSDYLKDENRDREEASKKEPCRDLLNAVQQIKRQARSPNYGHCFFVIGGVGSGKTHFIASLLAESASKEVTTEYFLALSNFAAHESLRDVIEREIEKCFGKSWSQGEDSLQRLCSFINSCGRNHLHPQSPLQELRKNRVIVVIDEFEKLANSEARMSELKSYIENTSNNEYLYWMISIRMHHYEKLCKDMALIDFWKNYGFNRHYEGDHSKSRQGIQTSDPSISGWLHLDEMNRQAELGSILLRRGFSTMRNQSCRDCIQVNDLKSRHFEVPLIVWIFLDTLDYLNEDMLSTDNYVEFVDMFWEKIVYLSTSMLHDVSLVADGLGAVPIAEVINRLVDLIVSSGLAVQGESRNFLEFIKSLRVAAEDKGLFFLNDSRLISCFVINMIDTNLLIGNRDFAVGGLISGPIEVKSRFFWDNRIARAAYGFLCRSADRMEVSNSLDIVKNANLEAAGQSALSEGVNEFLVLFSETGIGSSAPPLESKILELLCRALLKSDDSSACAVWFAGSKGSLRLQSTLMEVAKTQPPSEGRRQIFAFMNFVGDANIGATSQRIELLKPIYANIGNLNFGDYFLFIVKKLLADVNNVDELLACMGVLSHCEATNRAEQTAEVVIERLFELCNADVSSALDYLIERYITPSAREAERDRVAKKRRKWQRFFYREWVLFFFCRKAISIISKASKRDQYLVDAYELFVHKCWYYPRRVGVNGPISSEMERELNMALGSRFRVTRVEYFVDFVKSLVASKLYSDKKNSIYIIKHTVFTEGRDDVRVDSILYPTLKTLLMDERFEREAIRNARFLSVNLGELGPDELSRLKYINDLAKAETSLRMPVRGYRNS